MIFVVSVFLALGLPVYLVSLWRALPSIWRGERRLPIRDIRIFSIFPRSYLSGLLAVTAWYGGFAAGGAAMVIHGVFGFDDASSPDDPPAAVALMAVFIAVATVLLAVALPLTVLQWVVNAFNRPRRLVPPKHRGKPGWVGEQARRNARERASWSRTDHLVEIIEADAGDGPAGRFLVAVCDEHGCGWMEFADDGVVAEEEENLRAKAARHSSQVAAGVIRSGPDT
ncbi:hypothetical protein [Catellatospora vulcania]|uniref:hypothetical protein n=1 Tax=Catellatospora vulcania TaxID=1460450 RepID=UPI0012D3E31E|nr:hypothetical protein [Catellatospora vulcania]